MDGRERILKAFNSEPVDRVPWVPFVGVHGAFLIGKNADEYLQSADLMVRGIESAIEAYQPDGMPVCFDLQLEAEALGCKLAWSKENPPAVISHPLAGGKSVGILPVFDKESGRISLVLEAAWRARQGSPGTAMYGLITGPFTLALHLLGTDIFMMMFENPDYIKELLSYTAGISKNMADWYIEAGCDVIAVVDPMTSQIGPDHFEQFIHNPVSSVFSHIRNHGALSSFFVCGHAQQNIDVMCKTGPDNVSIDENIPLAYVRDICRRYGISFGGNLQLTLVLLMGSPEDCQKHALDCIDTAGESGFILAPGCDLPMKTPVENIKSVGQLVRDNYQRDVVRALDKTPDEMPRLNLGEYGQTDKVIVDIITLDSESCAPCQYMVEAVREVAPHFEELVEWREHSIKNLDGVTFMSSLFVKNIPTICIDGKISFVSQIPPKQELIKAIQKRINEKMKLRIREKHGKIVLAGSPEELREIIEKARIAILELGAQIEIETITAEEARSLYGISQSPAWINVRNRIKSEGTEPAVDVMREWIKALL
ncbi:MAG: uroporphyrinogen decarboxylase family protein [Bacteroidales bacterium]|nr:uroporphyrinogen decarboxylase family protein [Bacteroidales bacterium]